MPDPTVNGHAPRAKRLPRLVTGGALFLTVATACAQSPTVGAARPDMESIYGFDPTTMTFSEQAERAPSLSALWGRYDKSPESYREALRMALGSDGLPELLYCDGGMLLLHKSKLPSDRQLGLSAIAKCSLVEIEQTPYFYAMHELARDGVDTLDLQFKILTKPRYSAFIVQHALSLGQNYAFVYPLLLQDEAKNVPRLVERMRIEIDPIALKSMILALLYAATPESEQALRSIAATASFPESARSEGHGQQDRVGSRPVVMGAHRVEASTPGRRRPQ